MQAALNRRTAVLVLCMALIAAGCRSDDTSPATTAPTRPPVTDDVGDDPDGPSDDVDAPVDGSEEPDTPDRTEPPIDDPPDEPEEPDEPDEPDDAAEPIQPPDEERRPECIGAQDGVLTIGTLLPTTGDHSHLGPPTVTAALLAVSDVNAAGGVLGADVVLHSGNSGDITSGVAVEETERLLDLDSDVIIGAVASDVSFTVIDLITGSCVIQFSPANSWPDFTTYDDDGLYFRTAPSDVLQGHALAELALEDGHISASVIFRADQFGTGVATVFRERFERRGGTIGEFLAYPVDADTPTAQLDALAITDSDVIVVVGEEESAAILTAMHERGIGAPDVAVYGVDRNIGRIGGDVADPLILLGMKGAVPAIPPDDLDAFAARLDEMGDMGGVYVHAAETYDAIVITALATLTAGTDDPSAIAIEINGVTRPPGTPCFSFDECKVLVEAGEDIDYIGIGGSYEFLPGGEPSAASYRIVEYDGERTPNPDLDTYVFVS